MLDVTDLVLVGLISAFISAFICFVSAYIVLNLRNRDVDELYARLESNEKSNAGVIGQTVKHEKAARLNEAMGRLTQLFLEEKAKAGDGKMDYMAVAKVILPQVMGEFPDVALQIPGLALKMSKSL